MHAKHFRKPLRNAVEEIDSACEKCDDEGVDGRLSGVATQLEYYLEGNTTDPEALAYPPPGAIETIQQRLEDVADRTEDPAAEHVRNAWSHLDVVVPALQDRLHDGR